MNTGVDCLPVSVIVATRNRATLLAETLASILEGDTMPAEIIVVDQSDAPFLECAGRSVRGCAIRHVGMDARSLSRGRNFGADVARHDLLVFTDDDMTADHGWLRALATALIAAREPDAVTGRVLPGAQECTDGFVPSVVRQSTPAVHSGPLAVDVLAGGNMAIRRSAFDRVGRFDVRLGPGSDFPAAEDNDLGFRLLGAGGHILFVPDALLYHRAWRSADVYVSMRHAYGRGQGAFYAKHLPRNTRLMWRRLARDVGLRLVYPPRPIRHLRDALGEVAYAAGVVRGVIGWRQTV
jgi:GT2 family glycosyltransferase